MVSTPAIVILSKAALPLAERLREALGDAEIHGLDQRVTGADQAFGDTMAHLRDLHGQGRPIIGICAAAILIRALGPVLSDKRDDPPVIAVSEDGAHAVPLLGGHHGANALARRIAQVTGGMAAITTATDTGFGVALDEPPKGWTLANPDDFKPFATSLIVGERVRLDGEADWIAASRLPFADDGTLAITATDRAMQGSPEHLVFHPRRLAIGAGCERGCDPDELIGLCEKVLAQHGLAGQAVALVASLDIKADEAAMAALATHLGVPFRLFGPARLKEEAPRLANPSDIVMREVGVPGVAEAAALAAAGPDGALIVEKTRSKRGTIAVARAPCVIDPLATGRARGRLAVVGLGPGRRGWLSEEARGLLRDATDWVGYSAYLDMAGDARGKALHAYGLGEEERRVRHALELAGEGRQVALVCSGDPGIYALATLVFELLEADGERAVSAAARRAEIVVAPGISAFQGAAALAGAPMGHDFCAISLSDLLTPWPVIERRVRAVAEGDFVVAFYNPRSEKRRAHLPRAIDILRRSRPAGTPVILAREVGRPDENVGIVTLETFDPEQVDMRTLVIVGSSQSRIVKGPGGRPFVFTPRGYERKAKFERLKEAT